MFATETPPYLRRRPRRNRQSEAIRSLVQETTLLPHHLVCPLFVVEGLHQRQPIRSMPGIERVSIDFLLKEVEFLYSLGIRAVDLFTLVPEELKNRRGSEAVNPQNLLCRATTAIKNEYPEMCVMVDIALDPYTSTGHDGIVDDHGVILNDPTLEVLGEMAIETARAGVDIVAPSDMMDGRVAHLRKQLDREGFEDVGILSYTAKYASAFYGPFRDALESAPKSGDKKTYQMDPCNSREALLEAELDMKEGADMLLVKPATLYLDIIAKMRQLTHLPLGAYHVSGEYAMIMAAAERGWIDADRAFLEAMISIRRAGADFIFTYAAKQVASLLRNCR